MRAVVVGGGSWGTVFAALLRDRGHDEAIPHGALNDQERDDWAWASEAAARDVAEGRADQAVVCCWTGTGAAIAANKVKGVRAALVWNEATSTLAREHNDANVVSVGGRMHSLDEMTRFVEVFLTTPFPGDERHVRRIGMLADYEKTGNLPPLPESALGHGQA